MKDCTRTAGLWLLPLPLLSLHIVSLICLPIFNTAMLIVKRKQEVSPKMYVCENCKSTNQTAIRGLMPHDIFSLYALDAYPIDLKQTTQVLNSSF